MQAPKAQKQWQFQNLFFTIISSSSSLNQRDSTPTTIISILPSFLTIQSPTLVVHNHYKFPKPIAPLHFNMHIENTHKQHIHPHFHIISQSHHQLQHAPPFIHSTCIKKIETLQGQRSWQILTILHTPLHYSYATQIPSIITFILNLQKIVIPVHPLPSRTHTNSLNPFKTDRFLHHHTYTSHSL